MFHYVPAGLMAALAVLAFTPWVRRLALQVGMVALPGERRVHRIPTPLAGGLAIYAAFWLTVGLWSYGRAPFPFALWLASTAIVCIGLLDDRYTLPPVLKFLGQAAASGLLVAGGSRIEFVTNPFGGMLYVGEWGVPLTMLWLVAITNTLNFIDGLDGLASGVTAIACLPLFLIAMQQGHAQVALLALVLAGAAVGFLYYNFNPARIFLGDTGAMFCGFLLAAFAVDGALKGATAIALTVPLLMLGLPVLDTAFAIIRRFRGGVPVYQADKGHVHHRLLALGLTQRQAVVVLYVISGLMGLGALGLTEVSAFKGLVIFAAVGILASLAGLKLGVMEATPAGRRAAGPSEPRRG